MKEGEVLFFNNVGTHHLLTSLKTDIYQEINKNYIYMKMPLWNNSLKEVLHYNIGTKKP